MDATHRATANSPWPWTTAWTLPPGVRPNTAIFAANALPRPLTWQRRAHLRQRETVLAGIGRLLAKPSRGNAPSVLDTHDNGPVADRKTWALARKLEVLLFTQARSLHEYSNLDTLARRVQKLTSIIVQRKIQGPGTNNVQQDQDMKAAPAPTVPKAPTSTSTTAMGWPRTQAAGFSVGTTTSFFPTATTSTSSSSTRAMFEVPRVRRVTQLGLLLFEQSDVESASQRVWSFVDGLQILRCRSVSRAAYTRMPLLVTSLQLSGLALHGALTTQPFSHVGQQGGGALHACGNLRRLEVSSSISISRHRPWKRSDADHAQIMRVLAQTLQCRVFSQLNELALIDMVPEDATHNATDVLLQTLMTGCCPHLKALRLPGNHLGDYGAAMVAQVLRVHVCPELSQLDLRFNAIGEQGIQSLGSAFTDGCAPGLTELSLGGNLLTDVAFGHVLRALESRKLRRLRFLGVERNYLGADSLAMLGRVVGQRVCPELLQLSYGENYVENAEARRVISAAIYQARRLSWQAMQAARQRYTMARP